MDYLLDLLVSVRERNVDVNTALDEIIAHERIDSISQEMIDECVADTSIDGGYFHLYQMLINSVENQISDRRLDSMIDTLNYIGLNCSKMSKLEILFEYSKLI